MSNNNYNDIYIKGNNHLSVWPWSDIVSACSKIFKNADKKLKVLELGVGFGANIPFFLNHNCEYYGIEYSEYAVDFLKNKFPSLKNNLVVSDFSQELFGNNYDLIIDRASVIHADENQILKIVPMIFDSLNKGGYFIGVDWYSNEHSEYKNGDAHNGSEITRFNYKTGCFSDTGTISFVNKDFMLNLFKHFEIIDLINKKHINLLKDNYSIDSWNIVARKSL